MPARRTGWSFARWAQAKSLQQAARESALSAAALDPGLTGLGPILRGFGYVLDDQVGGWVPHAESMQRRGFVLSNGQWITREESVARVRASEEEAARLRAQREEQARAARADQLVALAELTLVRDLVQPRPIPSIPGPTMAAYRCSSGEAAMAATAATSHARSRAPTASPMCLGA